MDELYQAEWCPYSSRVRQRFTELGVSFVARPVPADRADREELRRKTGTDQIPALLLEDGSAISGDAEEIIAYLDKRYSDRADAQQHRDAAAEHDRA
ncbi:MAG TPA: glutathione S-transferase N-terminal domain-containing protein [Solirubrobacteraceae bacterium]|nr:glutathione S-transferase N-terminal domain-containing protein [Solirubrobacteraceae bacterium]